MRIAFLGPAPPIRGGISQFALSLASHYLSAGHEIAMFGFERQYPKLLFPGKTQTSEFELQSALQIINRLIPYRPDTWTGGAKLIASWKPDLLIISYFIPFFAPCYIWLLAKLNGIKRVALVHNLMPHETWLGARFLARTFLDRCDKAVCLSSSTLQELRNLMPNRIARKAELGYHPVYDQYLRTDIPEVKREPGTILFFGLVKRYKGLDILLKAMPHILKELPDVRLLIAGEIYGKDDEYLDMIRDLGISDKVEAHFRFIPDAEVGVFFQRASLVILPYRSASQSGIVALSYAFGLPVIASRLDGLAEYIEDGVSGILVNAHPEPQPAELAAAVIGYYNSGLYETMSAAVRMKAESYSWDNLCAMLLS